MTRTCSVVWDNDCKAPAGFRVGDGYARGTASTRATCFACGEAVCTNCSRRMDYFNYGVQRVCFGCVEPDDDFDDEDDFYGNAARGGKVHVLSEMCSTCIFRPGNKMQLRPGRVAEMVKDARRNESAITCHSTLYQEGVDNAVCRGFFDRHKTQPLQVAERLGLLVFDEVPVT